MATGGEGQVAPAMVNLRGFILWRPKPPDEAVINDLKTIEMHLVTHAQFNLFKETVAQLIERQYMFGQAGFAYY
jgi:hypothetical protein